MKETILKLNQIFERKKQEFSQLPTSIDQEALNKRIKSLIDLNALEKTIEILLEEEGQNKVLKQFGEINQKFCDCLFNPKPFFVEMFSKKKRCNYCQLIIQES
jgi:dynactin complex subunit